MNDIYVSMCKITEKLQKIFIADGEMLILSQEVNVYLLTWLIN